MSRLQFLSLVAGALVAAVIALAITLALVVAGQNSSNRRLDALTKQTLTLASAAHQKALSAGQLASAIQAQRVQITLANCRSLNRRHDDTFRTLDELQKRALRGASRVRRTAIRANRAQQALVLGAAVPYQDCGPAVKRVQVR